MMVVCAKCGCTIIMYAGEGPLCSCPMCGHQYNECTVGTSTSMPQDETESRPYKCFDDYRPVDMGPTGEMIRKIIESSMRDIENSRVEIGRKRNEENTFLRE